MTTNQSKITCGSGCENALIFCGRSKAHIEGELPSLRLGVDSAPGKLGMLAVRVSIDLCTQVLHGPETNSSPLLLPQLKSQSCSTCSAALEKLIVYEACLFSE